MKVHAADSLGKISKDTPSHKRGLRNSVETCSESPDRRVAWCKYQFKKDKKCAVYSCKFVPRNRRSMLYCIEKALNKAHKFLKEK